MTRTDVTHQPDREAALPAASVVIASRNRPQLLHATVESILAGEEVPAELVIVDQSDAPHQQLAAKHSVRGCSIQYLYTDQIGVSRARNAGIVAARYDLLVLTDDDVIVTPTWFGTILRQLVNSGRSSVITGKVSSAEHAKAHGFAPSTKVDETLTIYQGRVADDVLYSGNMAMYRASFDVIGGFDERLGPGAPFPAAEDNDFGFRLLEAGYRIIYTPAAELYHLAWRERPDMVRLSWNYGYGQGAVLAKHLSLRDRHMLWRMCHGILQRLWRIPHRLRYRSWEAFADAIYVLGLIAGFSKWLITQRGES